MSGVSESAKLNRRSAAKKKVDYSAADEFEFDDEDNLPLSQMKGSATKKKKKSEKSPASKSKKVVKKVVKKATPVKAAPTAKSDSSIFYNSCDKGKLIQEVLVRWWYAIEWPGKACQESPGPNYDALSAFPGVFVCVAGDSVGEIIDKRDKASCPNFTNMCKKPASELKALAVKAIDNQKIALEEAGEKGCPDYDNLNDVLKWVKSLQEGAMEKEAAKTIKEYKLKL